ncbi:MAG TPA: GNAT family N-acetyltransferase [Rhizomicrobium sp.]|nr:GNAT family N-acetyltransferase [Rhizomicrobium sp.]
MSNFTIRKAEEVDAPQILALIGALAAYEKITICLTEEAVRRDMLGAACHCDLAFQDRQAVGIATWYWTYKTFGARRGLFVEDLYVHEAWRGHGLGRALLAHLAAKATAAGGFLEWQVLDWNSRAIAFYESLGAKPLGQWLNYRLDGEPLQRLAL